MSCTLCRQVTIDLKYNHPLILSSVPPAAAGVVLRIDMPIGIKSMGISGNTRKRRNKCEIFLYTIPTL